MLLTLLSRGDGETGAYKRFLRQVAIVGKVTTSGDLLDSDEVFNYLSLQESLLKIQILVVRVSAQQAIVVAALIDLVVADCQANVLLLEGRLATLLLNAVVLRARHFSPTGSIIDGRRND